MKTLSAMLLKSYNEISFPDYTEITPKGCPESNWTEF